MEPNGFQQKVGDEQCFQTAISDFQNFGNYEKFWEKNQLKYYYQKNSKKIFEISKQNICERTLSGVYVHKILKSMS